MTTPSSFGDSAFPSEHATVAANLAQYKAFQDAISDTLVDILNTANRKADHRFAYILLQTHLRNAWQCIIHNANGDEEDAFSIVAYTLENLQAWPESLVKEEYVACLVLRWIDLLLPVGSASLMHGLQYLTSVWCGVTPLITEEQFNIHISVGRRIVAHLEVLTFGGQLRAMRRGQPEWADRIAHMVFYLLAKLVESEAKVDWNMDIFHQDGRVEWVRMGIMRCCDGMLHLAELLRTRERWSTKPDF